MLGVLLPPAVQQTRGEVMLPADVGGTLLTSSDLLADLKLEVAAEGTS
jgi:hypothetical protein